MGDNIIQSEMTIDDFALKIKNNLEDYFGDTKKIQINKVMKNNGVNLTGLTLTTENTNIAPTVYIDSCFDRYKKGEIYAQIMNELISTLEEHIVQDNIDMNFFHDYEKVRDNIVMKLINNERNQKLLEEIPSMEFLDMRIVFYYRFDEASLNSELSDNNSYSIGASILVRNDFLKLWGKSISDLYEDAYKNTRKLQGVEIQNLTELMKDILLDKINFIQDDDEKNMFKANIEDMLSEFTSSDDIRHMLVLTSNNKQYGAVNIVYKDILSKIASDYSSDLIILPSSIHEVIIIVNEHNMDRKSLSDMVREVNLNEVPIEDILSDSVYKYDRVKSEITQIC